VQIQTTTDSNSDPPPDGGYGWVQVGVAFTINAFTWGQIAVRSYFPLSGHGVLIQGIVILNIPSLLPLSLRIPLCHLHRLRLHRRSPIRPRPHNRTPRNLHRSQTRHSTPHATRHSPPNCRLHIRLLRLPSLAPLPLPRRPHRRRPRLHLRPMHTHPLTMVQQKAQPRNGYFIRWIWSRRVVILLWNPSYD
jgi:hypothetical protein